MGRFWQTRLGKLAIDTLDSSMEKMAPDSMAKRKVEKKTDLNDAYLVSSCLREGAGVLFRLNYIYQHTGIGCDPSSLFLIVGTIFYLAKENTGPCMCEAAHSLFLLDSE